MKLAAPSIYIGPCTGAVAGDCRALVRLELCKARFTGRESGVAAAFVDVHHSVRCAMLPPGSDDI